MCKLITGLVVLTISAVLFAYLVKREADRDARALREYWKDNNNKQTKHK